MSLKKALGSVLMIKNNASMSAGVHYGLQKEKIALRKTCERISSKIKERYFYASFYIV
jgi:hypothetical protein